jgi:peptide/nickel transport system substrate-binding protein
MVSVEDRQRGRSGVELGVGRRIERLMLVGRRKHLPRRDVEDGDGNVGVLPRLGLGERVNGSVEGSLARGAHVERERRDQKNAKKTLHRALCTAISVAMLCCTPHGRRSSNALEVVVAQDAETIDPRFVVDATGMRISRLVHAGLFRLDPDSLEPVPYLAASYHFRTPLILDVTLRSDVRFHSGAPLRAADVVATLEALKDPRVGARAAHVVSAIDRVEALGEHDVEVHLARPHATLLTDLEVPILRAGEARDTRIDGMTLDGLGPYRVTATRKSEVDLAPAEDSALAKPAHAVVVRTVHDENARALRLISGGADVAPSALSPSLLPALAQHGLRVAARPGSNLVYVLFRTDSGPFAGANVRRAFGLAIDRSSIVSYMLASHATLATGLLPPWHWASSKRPASERDTNEARALLGGARVRCVLLGSTDRLRVAIARVIAQDAADAGFDVEVVPLELGTLLARLGAGDFDAAVLQIPELAEPNTLRVFLHSRFVPPEGANRARVRDPAVDAALDRGDSTLDPTERREAYAALEQRVIDQAYWIPLWHEDQTVVTSARAQTFLPSAEGRWLGLALVP